MTAHLADEYDRRIAAGEGCGDCTYCELGAVELCRHYDLALASLAPPAAGQDLDGQSQGRLVTTKSTTLKERAVKPDDVYEHELSAAESEWRLRHGRTPSDQELRAIMREVSDRPAIVSRLRDPFQLVQREGLGALLNTAAEASKEIERLREARDDLLIALTGIMDPEIAHVGPYAGQRAIAAREAIARAAALQPILPSGGGREEGSSVAGVPCQLDTRTPHSAGGSR